MNDNYVRSCSNLFLRTTKSQLKFTRRQINWRNFDTKPHRSRIKLLHLFHVQLPSAYSSVARICRVPRELPVRMPNVQQSTLRTSNANPFTFALRCSPNVGSREKHCFRSGNSLNELRVTPSAPYRITGRSNSDMLSAGVKKCF